MEFYHHGVKGQKWGVKNGPPYPLKSRSVRKRANEKETNTMSAKGQRQLNKYLRDMELIRKGKKVTDELMYKVGSQYLSDHDDTWQEVEQRVYNGSGRIFHIGASALIKAFEDEGKKVYQKGYTGITDDDVKAVNPDFGKPGTTQNCTKCTAALEMRKYGYDVRAGRQSYPAGCDAFTYWFNGTERREHATGDVETDLKQYGKGSSGALSMFYPNNAGGHAMHWSINDSGQFKIEDAQNGRTFNSVREAAEEYGFDTGRKAYSYRLDNSTPNLDHMNEDGVLRSPEGTNTKVYNKRNGRIVDTW